MGGGRKKKGQSWVFLGFEIRSTSLWRRTLRCDEALLRNGVERFVAEKVKASQCQSGLRCCGPKRQLQDCSPSAAT